MKKYQFILEQRASVILYRFLIANKLLFASKTFLLPANICPVVACVFFKAKQKIELLDISPKTLCIDEEKVKNKLAKNSEKYAGVLFNYIYGNTFCFANFFTFLKKKYPHFIVIEDRCLCRPNIFFAEKEENIDSDLILFSTGKRKFLELESGGGFAFLRKTNKYHTDFLTEKYKVADDIFLQKAWKNKFSENNQKTNLIYLSQNLSWLNTSAFSASKENYQKKVSEKLPFCEAHKAKINQVYRHFLPKKNMLDNVFQQWRFQIFVPEKDILLQKISDNDLFASSHYASLSSILDLKKSFPIASELHSKVINLFNDYYFSEKQATKICEIILIHLEK